MLRHFKTQNKQQQNKIKKTGSHCPGQTHIKETFFQSKLDVGFDARPLLPFASVALDQWGQGSWVAHRVRRRVFCY